VRIRTIDMARAVLTVKFRTSSLRREEFEYDIPYVDALETLTYATVWLRKPATRYATSAMIGISTSTTAPPMDSFSQIELGNEADQPPRPQWVRK
jgi:CYTH domain-containing protein